ncbi:asparagine synthase (glutamine-hydrolyzing) [Adlercreutzia sp. R25]|uniref:asparagine synthase (glutamine-hydrolyzing) n=1 Tax=Adlercreutzia shanghongiae TaxID=3111773 RepID=A0ABU6J0X5_9ACTN|nr:MULTISPECIES: asparagine synthase (glutamine-hydrolyzing) [unclassified Adlercreutzia]MEC4271604.1 asparagine synthase (glutamine-hydrolyzing) [Adlercreutzia sp. R25]MEC4295757.1 asparagine synthase (glutamine-hydrolyzing) [Adlercreutzia sp. R22]
MCGFAGFFDDGAGYNRAAALDAMAAAIAHRGPDEAGAFDDGRCALGFRRLAIIDLEGASQPLFNEDGTLVLVFNGEIYNYRELRRRLEGAGHVFATQGDGEVLVHGFEQWGPRLLDELRGMFAFALYDRTRGELFCARDAFGIKPLYYAADGPRLLFASEIKALQAHPRFTARLNERRLGHWLCMEYLPDDETLIAGVRKLPAGHWLRWRDGRTEMGRWFSPHFVPDTRLGADEAAEAIEDVLRESVAAHAIADVEVGCFLSAGVDSSLVASEAARIMDARTFSIGYGEERYSELAAARAFASAVGLSNQGRTLTAEEFFASVPAVQYAMDEPLPNPSAIPLYHLCRMTAESVKVVLSGEGADELFGGYPYYQECLSFGPYMAVPANLRHALAAGAARLPEGTHGRRFLMRGARPFGERYLRLEYNFPWNDALDLLQPDLAALARGAGAPWEAAAPLLAEACGADAAARGESAGGQRRGSGAVDEVTAMQTADILTWMQQDILLKADKMSMAASLELRVPFLDREVFAVARTLPAELRVTRTETKPALRRAAARTLPARTAAMPKKGFLTPLAQWLREEPWAAQVREVLHSATARRFFRTEVLDALLDEHRSGARSHMKRIWSAYCFTLWHEAYFG